MNGNYVRIFLAPMEGVVNHTMRTVLTELGGIDRCVTEFVRVTNTVYPKRVFYRYSPELKHQGKTPNGTPVYVQLLGSRPELMAANAVVACHAGAPGIDINFGCPSKLVNKNEGGSILLRDPEKLFNITSAIRKSVPPEIPVTAKIRLGYEDTSLFNEITDAIFSAQADELAIHARTKVDGYKPPAHWHFIKGIKDKSPVPLIPNGEVWNEDDYVDCMQQSGCSDVMIGRGILARPDLPQRIKRYQQNISEGWRMDWLDAIRLLITFFDLSKSHYEERHLGNPVKQWMVYLKKGFPELVEVFDVIKRLKNPHDVRKTLVAYLD